MAGVFRRPARPQQRRPAAYPAAPVTYTVPVGGALGSSGSLRKAVTHRGLVGTSTPAGALRKTHTRGAALTGTLTSTGTVAPTRVFIPATPLVGSLTSGGFLNAKTVTHRAAGTSTPTGIVRKAVVHRGLAGTQTPTGTVSTAKFQMRQVGGSLTSSGALRRQVTRRVSGSLTSGGGGPRSARRRVSGSCTPTGSMAPQRRPASGTWLSPPILLPEDPIAGSRIYWEHTTPPGTQLLVHTSVDNGASWQIAAVNQPIPRLPVGSSTWPVLLVRVSMSRPDSATMDTPRLHRLDVLIQSDSSIDEFCPLGVFGLAETSINDSAAGTSLSLSGNDLSRTISRNRWDSTFVVEEGTNYGEAIRRLVEDRLPGVVTNFESTERLTPRLFFGEQGQNDPWQDAQDLATAIGYELYFDPAGICVLRGEPDPDIHEAVWEFEDSAHPSIVTLSRRVSDANTYNKVIAQGEGSSNDIPVQAVAEDLDPASPTYIYGPYGTVTYIYRSAMITTEQQAQDAADALLLRVKGVTESVEVSAVPMPALEPGDVVSVTRARAKLEGRFLIDAMSIPLGPAETMRITGRRQRI